MKKKYAISVLGCRTNQYEAQAFADQLDSMGYELASEGEKADLCIVNTCTVTESADKRSLSAVKRLKRDNPGARVVVTGCAALSKMEELGQYGEIVPNKDKEKLLEKVFPETEVPEFRIKNFEAHTRAFVKVQDGCNSYCSYCVIPLVRGRSVSRPLDEVLSEVHGLVENGFREVVITGINVGDYDKPDLATLVRKIDQVKGLERLRISSIDPDEVDDELLDAVVNGRVTCHSMHIVLQSGSNSVLKRMRRKYTKQEFYDTVKRLRAASPDFTFTTDVIVGFPGEDEGDFEETLEVIREVKFAKVHMFPYSVRPKTRAERFEDKVDPDVIEKRRLQVMEVANNVAFELREAYVGRTMPVLIESDNKGHTENFLPVKIEGKVRSNEIVQVKMMQNTMEGLIGYVD
ncbi:MAG: Threonylcarbamoyladenosine tRNA methylthiotransferase MtaB [Chlamydiia bacterium]|nr:Threonylcarbamoyladenosine tRNA methylthiotransferase MtaB [Chlamydiia bacterium]MCH9615980.1 Threonylcarbamoyladenosine tRNA methylthiotransferase MtaB [Chlamydiia bacterium]MCH9628617.1 Threonylcarbamoyladenosine tRNA methylthiotransferase MtaB [Chlamydiia bacterium]